MFQLDELDDQGIFLCFFIVIIPLELASLIFSTILSSIAFIRYGLLETWHNI